MLSQDEIDTAAESFATQERKLSSIGMGSNPSKLMPQA